MYRLHLLGWYNFQQLCLTILREILGQSVESFLDSNDAGRDGAFTGVWHTQQNETMSGRFVFQCKFTSKADYNLRPSDVSDELAKVKSLVDKGLCDNYILITNAGLSAETAAKIKVSFELLGIKQFVCHGSTWINQQIRESVRLRTLVPRVYGLGDLGEIIDERAYSQAAALLQTLTEELAKVVVTKTYQNAVEAINAHGFVLLIGEAAAGKTTIASLLAMAALDQWKSRTIKIDDPASLISHWNPSGVSQFFWIDDAFGVTQYESPLATSWNHALPQVKAMLQKDVKIVMTSRDYIYNQARKDLKTTAFPLFQESQIVIDVHKLTLTEKRQILYNHLKLGKQNHEFKKTIKPFLEKVAQSDRFIPETARRLADPIFTKNLYISEYLLDDFVIKQESFLKDLLNSLDRDSKAALALIYMRNDKLNSPIKLQDSEEQALKRLDSTISKCIFALDAMKGSLVQYIYLNGEAAWKFKHPTIGDAFSSILVENPELIEVYLLGGSIDKIMSQITCGDVGYQNAVIVPSIFFSLIVLRLNDLKKTDSYKTAFLSVWDANRKLLQFLSNRCSKEFLQLYLKTNASMLEQISNPDLAFNYSPELDFAIKLKELALLPEGTRSTIIHVISEHTVNGEDFYLFESEEIKTLYMEDELNELYGRVTNELIPNLRNIRSGWQSNFNSNGRPEDHIDPLLDGIKSLKKHFEIHSEIVSILEKEKQHIEEWIDENGDSNNEVLPRHKLEEAKSANDYHESRSIFDDIDL